MPVMTGDIKAKAFKTLTLQDELVEAFLREHQPQAQSAEIG